MYKIIGADQKVYGPIPADMVRQWVSEGRANAATQAQAEGAAEWKPLSAFAEFAPLFAPKPPPASAPDDVPAADPERLAADILARDYDLDIGSCLGRAWKLVCGDFWPVVGVSALITLLLGAGNSLYVGIVVNGPLMGGLSWYFLKRIRGERADLNTAFEGFSRCFLQLFLASLVSGLLTLVGFICCILPGIYLSVAWWLVFPLVMDKRLEFWPAMELSRKVISRHWWMFLLFLLLLGLVMLAGLLALIVGIFVAIPVVAAAQMYAYEDIFGDRKH